MKKNILYIIALVLVLSSCSGYQRLLRSGDNHLKLERAREFYDRGQWQRTIGLLESVAPFFRGTHEAGDILQMLASSHFNSRRYITAANIFRAYVSNFPSGERVQHSRFMIAYSYYRLSPDVRLDQSDTHNAIAAFEAFLQLHPYSERTSEASRMKQEMLEKLAYKELLNARLYYRLGTFQGNNYLSAVIVAQNAMNDFPLTQYREEFAIVILRAKHAQALRSVAERRNERLRETIDQFHVFVSEFPQGRHIREAERILSDAQRNIRN